MSRPRTALITGASTGIGAELARQLAASGTRVALVARSADKLEALVAELGGEARALALPGDVSEPAEAERLVHEAERRLDGIELLIANAGTGYNVKGPKMEVEHITKVLQLNVMGACATIAAGVQGMVARGSGHLVGISSVAANRGLPTSAAYCASKAALSVFLESLSVDLARTGVKVTDIRPGFVDTPLTKKNKFDMPFLMGPDRAAGLILRAIERERPVYTFPWQMAAAAWLLRRIPGPLYRGLAGRAPL